MLRKILSFFFALFMLLPVAHSAEMVNVEYIHNCFVHAVAGCAFGRNGKRRVHS